MTSDYLNRPKTLDELDALFAADRVAAAAIAETIINQEIATAISNVTEIHHIANARIQADSAVASAKIAADAEVCATELVSRAELAVLEIRSRAADTDITNDQVAAMISEIGYSTREEITNSASDAVGAIRQQAEAAIGRISDLAKNSIMEIRSSAEKYADRVRENAEIARRKLEERNRTDRLPENATDDAQEAAARVLQCSEETTKALHANVSSVIHDINALTGDILSMISESVAKAEARVLAARDKALASIQRVLDVSLRLV